MEDKAGGCVQILLPMEGINCFRFVLPMATEEYGMVRHIEFQMEEMEKFYPHITGIRLRIGNVNLFNRTPGDMKGLFRQSSRVDSYFLDFQTFEKCETQESPEPLDILPNSTPFTSICLIIFVDVGIDIPNAHPKVRLHRAPVPSKEKMGIYTRTYKTRTPDKYVTLSADGKCSISINDVPISSVRIDRVTHDSNIHNFPTMLTCLSGSIVTNGLSMDVIPFQITEPLDPPLHVLGTHITLVHTTHINMDAFDQQYPSTDSRTIRMPDTTTAIVKTLATPIEIGSPGECGISITIPISMDRLCASAMRCDRKMLQLLKPIVLFQPLAIPK
jgi:hypothetical protein